jgi:hypothetical protein
MIQHILYIAMTDDPHCTHMCVVPVTVVCAPPSTTMCRLQNLNDRKI